MMMKTQSVVIVGFDIGLGCLRFNIVKIAAVIFQFLIIMLVSKMLRFILTWHHALVYIKERAFSIKQ